MEISVCIFIKKGHRKVQGVPQSEAAANPWHQEEEKYRLNFGEVDVAPAKNWKMTKLTKWKTDKN